MLETKTALKTAYNQLSPTETKPDAGLWQLDLYTGRLSWSNELCNLLNISKPYTPTLEQLIRYYQPEQNLRTAFNRAIHQGIPFDLELPALTAHNKIIPVYTTGSPVYDDYGKCIAIKGTLQTAEQETGNTFFTTENLDEQVYKLENFARIVSHNLRSHTSNLQMVLASIDQKTSSKEIKNMLGSIKTISSNLNQTVGYLNTLVKI